MTSGNVLILYIASSDSQSNRLQYEMRHRQETLLIEPAAN